MSVRQNLVELQGKGQQKEINGDSQKFIGNILSIAENGASQYIFLFNILTKRTKTSRNTRLSFGLDITLLLSNFGYADFFVNLLLLGN